MTHGANNSPEDRLAALLSAYDEARTSGSHPHQTSIDLSSLSPEEGRLYSQLREFLENVRAAVSPYPSPTESSSDPLEFGRFVVEDELGRGGFGVVFLARDPQLKRQVALKLAHWSHFSTADRLEQFELEAQAAARLQHPGIATVHETGHFAGGAYIATEYCSGGSLREWMHRQSGPVNPRLAAFIIKEIAWSLHHAHERGVLHQDIKPSNVLLMPMTGPVAGKSDFPYMTKLTDFGLAKFLDEGTPTHAGHRVGTPWFMSPEQSQGRWEDVGVPSDIFGLGVILFELLVGQITTDALKDSKAERISDVAYGTLLNETRPRIPVDLLSVCLRCLEESIAKRYRTAADLAEDLERYLQGRLVHAREASPLEHAANWVRRKPASAIAIATLLVLATSQLLWMKKSNDDLKDLNAELIKQRDVIVSRESTNRLQLYDLAMRDAQEMLDRGQYLEADRLLSAYDPSTSPANAEVRTFDWYFLWNLFHSRTPREMKCHETDVYDVDVSPNGRLLATSGRDGTVVIWNLPARTKQLTLRGHQGDVNSARFSPDGETIASAGDDQTVRIWSADNGELLHTLTGHEKQVNALSFSPWGDRLYSSGQDGVVRLWDPITGKPVASTPARPSRILMMTSLADGSGVVAADYDRNVIAWSENLDRVLWALEGRNRPDTRIYSALAHEGHPLYLGGMEGHIESRDPATGNRLAFQKLDSLQVQAIALSKDQSSLLIADENGSVFSVDRSLTKEPNLLWRGRSRNWGIDTSQVLNEAFISTSDGSLLTFDSNQSINHPVATHFEAEDIRSIALSQSPDSPLYCLTGSDLRAVDAESGITNVVRRVPASCRSFDLDDAGTLIALAPAADLLLFLDAESLETVFEIPRSPESSPQQVDLIAFDPRGTKVALGGSRSNKVEVWDIEAKKLLVTIEIAGESLKQIEWLSASEFLCVGDSLEVFRVGEESTQRRAFFDPPASIIQCAVDPRGPILALDRHGALLTISPGDMRLISSSRTWLDRPQSMSAVVDDHVVITDAAGNIAHWNISLSRAEEGTFLKGHRLGSCALRLGSDVAFVVTDDTSVKKIRLDSRPNEHFLSGSGAGDIRISQDGRWASASMTRGTTIVHDLQNHRPATPHEFVGTASAFSFDGLQWALVDNEAVRWFDVGTWKEVGRWVPPTGQFVDAMDYLADGRLVLAMRPGGIAVLSTTTGEVISLSESSYDTFTALAVAGSSGKIAIAHDDRGLRIWDIQGTDLKPRALLPSEDVMSMSWSHDGNLLGIGGRYGTISIYDHAENRWQKGMKIETISDISDIAFSPDDQVIIVLNRSDSIHFGDLRSRLFTYGLRLGQKVGELAMSTHATRLVVIEDHGRAGWIRWFNLDTLEH